MLASATDAHCKYNSMEERVPTPAIPESLRGRLKAAHQELESATLLETPSTSTPPLRIANVIARSSDEWCALDPQ